LLGVLGVAVWVSNAPIVGVRLEVSLMTQETIEIRKKVRGDAQ